MTISTAEPAAEGLPTVAPGMFHFREKLSLSPRGLAARVPLAQRTHRIVIVKGESPHDAAAHAKRMRVTSFTFDGGRNAPQICTRAGDDVPGASLSFDTTHRHRF